MGTGPMVPRSRNQDEGKKIETITPREEENLKSQTEPERAKPGTREKKKSRTEKEHTVTHGKLFNQILADGFGKSSGREGRRNGRLKSRFSAPNLRGDFLRFIFLNSSISSPQIANTAIPPRTPLDPNLRGEEAAFDVSNE